MSTRCWSDVDFNQQPVRLYWPRSLANEAFVALTEAGFSVDCALSVDRRHDGSPAYVENDAGNHHQRATRCGWQHSTPARNCACSTTPSSGIEALRCRVFDAVPDAVLVIDEHRSRSGAMRRSKTRSASPMAPDRTVAAGHGLCLNAPGTACRYLICMGATGISMCTARAFWSVRGGVAVAVFREQGVASRICIHEGLEPAALVADGACALRSMPAVKCWVPA